MIRGARHKSARRSGNQHIVSINPEFQPRPRLPVRFLDLFLRLADSFASDPSNFNVQPQEYHQPEAVYIVTALNDLEPIIVQSFPALIGRVNTVRAKATGMLNEKGRNDISGKEKFKASSTRSFDERMAELEKADEERKLTDAMILQTLISGLKTEEQFARFEPWIDKMVEA